MGITAVRLCVLAAAMGVASLVSIWEECALVPPEAKLPSWTFDELPYKLGDWQGEDTELDPEITKAVGAAPGRIVERRYVDKLGHAVSMHTAMFSNPVEGVYHSPFNCYRSNGWELQSSSREELQLSDDLAIPVIVTQWKLDSKRAAVVYWYQLGEHVLFGRFDLGMKVRWALAGKPYWPALVKVMMHTDAADAEDAKAALLNFAEQVAKWENQPERRKELLLIED